MADGKYPGLPLEQRIGSIGDGEVTNFGPLIRSNPLTIQPTRRRTVADDIVLRLRAYDCDGWEAADEIERLRAENERLRALGDALADAATRQQWSRLDVAVAAWQEARRV